MRPDKAPPNIVRFARDHMTIGPDVNWPVPVRRVPRGSEGRFDHALCWTSYYTLVFAALVTFLPYETAFAVERTADLADQVGNILGLDERWGAVMRGAVE